MTVTVSQCHDLVSLLSLELQRPGCHMLHSLGSLGGASTRDVQIALRIVLADHLTDPSKNELFEKWFENLHGVEFMLGNFVPEDDFQKIASLPGREGRTLAMQHVRNRSTGLREPESPIEDAGTFANFCISLGPSNRPEYWEKVYKRLNLVYLRPEILKHIEQHFQPRGCLSAVVMIIAVATIWLIAR